MQTFWGPPWLTQGAWFFTLFVTPFPSLKKTLKNVETKGDFPDVCMTPYDKIMAANVEFNRFSPAISDLLHSIFVLCP